MRIYNAIVAFIVWLRTPNPTGSERGRFTMEDFRRFLVVGIKAGLAAVLTFSSEWVLQKDFGSWNALVLLVIGAAVDIGWRFVRQLPSEQERLSGVHGGCRYIPPSDSTHEQINSGK